MDRKQERVERLNKIIEINKTVTMEELIKIFKECYKTIQRDLKTVNAITSYTHRGKYITLPDIPAFDENGIWFYKQVGFTKFKNSFDLIINLINAKECITREELEEILHIQISKQIQILLTQNRLHRVKLGAKYCYLSKDVAKDEKRKIQLLDIDIEDRIDRKIKIADLVAVLKAVLVEYKIDMNNLKKLIKKYSLEVPVKKVEQIILKYNLSSKKKP